MRADAQRFAYQQQLQALQAQIATLDASTHQQSPSMPSQSPCAPPPSAHLRASLASGHTEAHVQDNFPRWQLPQSALPQDTYTRHGAELQLPSSNDSRQFAPQEQPNAALARSSSEHKHWHGGCQAGTARNAKYAVLKGQQTQTQTPQVVSTPSQTQPEPVTPAPAPMREGNFVFSAACKTHGSLADSVQRASPARKQPPHQAAGAARSANSKSPVTPRKRAHTTAAQQRSRERGSSPHVRLRHKRGKDGAPAVASPPVRVPTCARNDSPGVQSQPVLFENWGGQVCYRH